jgi:hypothetical protein
MWPDTKQAHMHSTWEQPVALNSYKLAFTYFYKWKHNICVYIEGKKQHNQPDKPSAPPSQAHCPSFTCTPRLGLNTGPFCGPRDPERVYTSEWPSPCTQPLPTYCLKQAIKVITTSSCVRIMQRYFEGTEHAKRVSTPSSCARIILRVHHIPKSQAHPLKLCKNNAPTCAGLTHTSDSNSTLDRCQQAGRTSLDDSTSAMGPYCRQYTSTLYSFFPWLPNWGTSWWCPNTKKLCLIINALAM